MTNACSPVVTAEQAQNQPESVMPSQDQNGITDSHDSIPDASDACSKGYIECPFPQLLSVNSSPFLDTTAIYVRLLTHADSNYEHDGQGAVEGAFQLFNTLVFAGQKHRFIGQWIDTDISESLDVWHDEDCLTKECSYSYLESTAVFDGQINASTATNWSLENKFVDK